MCREITTADASQLRNFECHGQTTWTRKIEGLVRTFGDQLAADDYDTDEGIDLVLALGIEVSSILRAVALCQLKDSVLEVIFIAVSTRYQRSGLGRRLKSEILSIARARDDVDTVLSYVHRANKPMLGLNKGLGAIIESDPEDSNFYMYIFDSRTV